MAAHRVLAADAGLPDPAAAGQRPTRGARSRCLVDTGCQWSALPSDHPPFQTVFGFFSRWTAATSRGAESTGSWEPPRTRWQR